MATKTEEVILYDSPEAAQPVTVSGWKSRDGRFWKDEASARYSGCTHMKCECGNLMSRGWTKCDSCRQALNQERFFKLPFKEWNGEPVCLPDGDKYFFSEEEVWDYCFDQEIEELNLLIASPNYMRQVSSDYWEDIYPEEADDIPKEVREALDKLNEVISKQAPFSYSPGKFRTKYIFNVQENKA